MLRPSPLAPTAALLLAGCAVLSPPELAVEPPPLEDMEEPLALFDEPADEGERADLPAGAFTGVYVRDARATLEAMLGEPEGLVVEGVVENSPAAAAGLEVGDLLLEADAGSGPLPLRWPSDWRALELAAEPGAPLDLLVDRAGLELEVRLVPAERVRPAARRDAQRFREEERVGLVVRTATEVEARAAGLAPGAGAVVVGLARESPWRGRESRDGLRFGDLVVEAGGRPVAHPRVLLDAIRATAPRDRLRVAFLREGARGELDLPVSRRARETKEIRVPLLYRYSRDGRRTELSLLLGLYKHSSTPAAWRARLLWLIRFGRGDADRLLEVGE